MQNTSSFCLGGRHINSTSTTIFVNSTSATVNTSCHPELVLDSKGKCVLPCATWSWLSSDETLTYVVDAYFASTVLVTAGIITVLVWIKCRSKLYGLANSCALLVQVINCQRCVLQVEISCHSGMVRSPLSSSFG